MKEDYKKQLKLAEESRTQALEELTKMYEIKLKEKTWLLAQVSHKEHDQDGEAKIRSSSLVQFCFIVVLFPNSVRRRLSRRSVSLSN